MISTIVGAYSFKLKDGTEKIKLTLSEEVDPKTHVVFGTPSNSISFKKERFCNSSGKPIPFNESIIGQKYLIDFGIFEDRESGKSISYPKSFDEVN